MVKDVTRLAAAAAVVLAGACNISVNNGGPGQEENGPAGAAAGGRENADAQRAGTAPQTRGQDRDQLQNLRFVVDKSDRELRIFQEGTLIRTEKVAIGKPEIPTPVGSWKIHRVDINPEWIPTNEPWARNRTRKGPGDPANPMGRARLVYRMPNTIHGTDDTNSLGKAVSHGSVRVSNAVVLQLAEMLLRAGGSWQGPEWFGRMTQDRTREYRIPLRNPVPVDVQD